MRDWRDGRVKLATTALLLAFRREHAELFAEGGYGPIEMEGDDANLAFGFIRRMASDGLRSSSPAFRRSGKRSATGARKRSCRRPVGRVFRGRRIDARSRLREWLGALPVAVLTEA